MKLTYKHTIAACFTEYIVRAIINNFAPLLYAVGSGRQLFPNAYGSNVSGSAYWET